MSQMTIDALKRQWEEHLLGSEEAIHTKNDEYRELKRLLHEINSGLIDVGDYYRLATRLGSLLSGLSDCNSRTIFHYFAEQIDPRKAADVRCFRFECLDLAHKIKELDLWRAKRCRVRCIK